MSVVDYQADIDGFIEGVGRGEGGGGSYITRTDRQLGVW
jgi:hypothetical protein